MAISKLVIHLPDWHLLLQGWSTDGRLSAAAQEALLLDDEPALLTALIEQWSEVDFSGLPPIVLLPASSMPGAAGAYAISTGTIYINQAWLESASTDAVLSVLTQELGHHLDALLNSSDTSGDEGALFAALLENPDLSAEAIETYRTTDDSGTVYVDGQWIEVQTQFLENEKYRRIWDTAADSLGNLFRASGGEDISNNNPDNNKSLVVDMIASDGSHKWDVIINGSQIDYLSIAITIFPSGLGGGVALTYADGNQTIVKRLALDGSEYWTTSLSNPFNDITRADDIGVSASGTVLLSGVSRSSSPRNSFFATLSPDGEQKSFSLVSSQNLGGLFVSTMGGNESIVAGTDIGSFDSRSSFYQIIGDLGERIGDKSPLFPDYSLDSTINNIIYDNGYIYATGWSGVKYPYVDDQEIPGYPGYPPGFITKISAKTGEREWTRLSTFGDGPQASGKDIFIMEDGSIVAWFREELSINDYLVSYRANGEVGTTIDLQKSLRTAGIANKYFDSETHLSYSNGKFYYSYAAFDQDINLVSNNFTSGTLFFGDSFAELNFGQASFSITGTRAVGQTLAAAVAKADPDGNGSGGFSYTWQSSTDGSTWGTVGSNSASYAIAATDKGKQLRLIASYTDAQGFPETVNTSAGTVPFVNDGQASFSITGTPAVGQKLTATVATPDPDGNGSSSYTWQTSANGTSWSTIGTDAELTIHPDQEGQQLRLLTTYTDGQGFPESVTTAAGSVLAVAHPGNEDDPSSGSPDDNTPSIQVTYKVELSHSSINEGGSLTTRVSTTGIPSRTRLYWSLSGEGITSSDFQTGSLQGSGQINANGKFTFKHQIARDNTTEGDEQLRVQLFSENTRKTLVAEASVLIKDTSRKTTATAESDRLTGLKGSRDIFVFSSPRSSLLAKYDIITNYENRDRISFEGLGIPETISTSGGRLLSKGKLTARKVNSILGGRQFKPGSAAAFKVDGAQGTYLVVNDAQAGFQQQSDALIYLRNFDIDKSSNSVVFM